MATVADALMLKMGFDGEDLKKGLNSAKGQISQTTKAMEQMGSKWTGVAKGLLKTIAAPVAGFMSFGAVMKSYFGGVAQVAKMTGAYSTKMEEWRKKRAMLARVNREDIELYRKGREAVTKFQITMGDLSAKIMRTFSPAMKWAVDGLNKFSDWVSRNEPNIIRFGKVTVGVVTATFIAFKLLHGQLLKTAAAMLMNPLTWIILGVGALILLIDDLITYLNGGDAAFSAFWEPCVKYAKMVWEWVLKVWESIKNSAAIKALTKYFELLGSTALKVFDWIIDKVGQFLDHIGGADAVFETIGRAFSAVFEMMGGVLSVFVGIFTTLIGGIVALFTGDTELMQAGWESLCEGFASIFEGAANYISTCIEYVKKCFWGFLSLFGISSETVTKWGNKLREALNVSRLIDWIKEKLKNMLPDWVLKMMGADTGSGDKKEGSAPAMYKETDAPIVPPPSQGDLVPNARALGGATATTTNNKAVNIHDQAQWNIQTTVNMNGGDLTDAAAGAVGANISQAAEQSARRAHNQANAAQMAVYNN